MIVRSVRVSLIGIRGVRPGVRRLIGGGGRVRAIGCCIAQALRKGGFVVTLSDALHRDRNDFDQPRLVAAGRVIVGHAHALVPRDDFAHPRTWSYVWANISLSLQWDLPGVFVGLRNPAVNGSLWTLPIEVSCYLVLLATGLPGVLRHRLAGSVKMIAIVVYAVIAPDYLSIFGRNSTELRLLPV